MAIGNLGKCCMVVPLEPGVLSICVIFFVYGLWNFTLLFLDETRLESYNAFGGYKNIATGFVAFSSLYIIFGLLGVVGVMDRRKSYMKAFYYFLFVQLVASFLIFCLDYRLLSSGCIRQDTVKPVDFNPSVDFIARMGLCSWARYALFIGFFITMAFRVYFYVIVGRYIKKTGRAVADRIAFGAKGEPEDADEANFVVDDMGDEDIEGGSSSSTAQADSLETSDAKLLAMQRGFREEQMRLVEKVYGGHGSEKQDTYY